MPGAESPKPALAVTGVAKPGEKDAHPGSGEEYRDRGRSGLIITAIVVACVVVGYYLGFMTYLAVARNDRGWDHLVFLLSGLEAIVFAAGGLLFGTTIQRGAVEHARAEAGSARADADKAGKRADRLEEQATGGQAVAALARGLPKPAAPPKAGAGVVPREDAARRAEKASSEYEVWHAALLGLVDTYFPAPGKE